jgi:hypothetical protein
MRELGRRPVGRLCCFAMMVVSAFGVRLLAFGNSSPQGVPATTTVADTVYLADGTPAQGTLIITWPAFVTSSGNAIAAGSTSVTLGANGALSVALVPNAGATPAGVYYSVVYQLGPGQVKTEYWVVPTTSPANLAAVTVTPGVGVAGQPVSMQYLNSQLSGVVHLSGSETITGVKTFSAAPNVPAPVNSGDVANKAYVDSSVSNVGSGNFLPLAGGAMTGPITLPASPAAPMQAATKQYVDTGLASTAGLIAGLVPANELGSGTATGGSCLLGNGASAAWGACGGGSGSGNVSTTPSANQSIAQPEGTQFSTNNFANIRYVTPNWNWAQTPADNLATAGNVTIHLAPCPLGVDTTPPLASPPPMWTPVNQNYYAYDVYISGTGTPEAVMVTGGTCTPGAASGTITVTTANAHAAGYVVGSASSGIQEAWNDGWTTDSTENAAPYVKLMSNTIYNVYATVYLRGRGPTLDGTGAQIACYTRDRCIYIGITEGHPYVHYATLLNLYLNPAVPRSQQAWSYITSMSAAPSGSYTNYTITTPTAHSFLVGDTVDCEYSTTGAASHIAGPVQSAGYGATQFEITIYGNTTLSAGAYTFGFCHILNAAVEDNSDHVVLENFQISQASNVSSTGVFNFGFVNDNDQSAVLNQATNRGSGVLDLTYPVNAFIYQRIDQGFAGITYIEDAEISNVNCVTAGGNGMTIKNSVCQGFPTFGVRYFGGLQPVTIENVYQESSPTTPNVLYGYASAMGYLAQGGARNIGTFPVGGALPTFNCTGGSATTARNYYVIPKNGAGFYGPMIYAGASQASGTGACGGVSVPVKWPSVLGVDVLGSSVGAVTYDLIWTSGSAMQPLPGATANYVEINSTGVTCSYTGMCSISDPQTESTTYTLPTQGNFQPRFWFWPSGWVLNNTTLISDQAGQIPAIVSSKGFTGVSSIATNCIVGALNQPQSSQLIQTCLTPPPSSSSQTQAMFIQQISAAGGSAPANSKGYFNLGSQVTSPNDLLTLADSNVYKTLTTAGARPSNDAGDMALGVDQSGGLDFRAASSVSTYINTIPTGTNYLERLTNAAKTFNVPVTVNGNLAVTSGTVTLPVTGSGSQCLHVSSSGVVSGTGADCGSGGSGTVNSGTTSQVAMYAGSGSAVSGDSALTDNGTTLNYGGSGGIAAATGTFSGNLTVNGQLLVAGPWMVSSPIPGSPMGAAGAGTSALGISNDGNFYISANGGTPLKVATTATSSYFSNLFQEDANDLGEYNASSSTTAQNFHVYSSYTNSSTWTRTSVGYDSTDGYSVLRSESSPSGGAPGLGLWVNSGLKWVIDASTSSFKPWTDQSYNIGTFSGSSGVGLRPATVFVAGNSTSGSGFELGKFASNSYELCNDTTNGTLINGLAVLTSAGCAQKPMGAATTGVIGVVIAGAGASGTVTLVRTGSAYCSFDGTATVVGDYVVASPTQNPSGSGFYPLCHDAGSTLPSGQQILGRVLQATSGSATAQMFFDMPGSTAGPNAISSVFGRTGAVVAASGDYSVAQITGAAPAASPSFSGTVTEPDGTTNTSSGYAFAHALTLPSGSVAATQSAGDNSTKVATTAYVRSEGQFAWTCPVAGATTTGVSYCNWTVPANLTITQFDLAASTAPAGCTTYPTLQVWDGKANVQIGSYSTAMTSGSNFYNVVTGSTNLAAGEYLRIKVTTGGAGCSTAPAGIVATVTYQMQN